MSEIKARKPYSERALRTSTTSRRFQAGTRKNKRLKTVGSFASDKTARTSEAAKVEVAVQ